LSNRQEYRQHSKSTLLRAAQVLYTQRDLLDAAIAQKWRRRLVAATVLAFLAGAGAGGLAARALDTGAKLIPKTVAGPGRP